MVHGDPELEADVFEELDPDIANRLFEDMTDDEVAELIAQMRADDAADAIAELPQNRRVEGARPAAAPASRTKVVTLLGFNATSAGGIMGVEFLAVPDEATVEEALRRHPPGRERPARGAPHRARRRRRQPTAAGRSA